MTMTFAYGDYRYPKVETTSTLHVNDGAAVVSHLCIKLTLDKYYCFVSPCKRDRHTGTTVSF